MAVCLIKAILFALLAVFVVMPGLLILFGPLMDKTQHRSFIPKIPFVGKFAYLSRFVIPPVFLGPGGPGYPFLLGLSLCLWVREYRNAETE